MPSQCQANVKFMHNKRGSNPSKCKPNVNLCQANAQFVFRRNSRNSLIYKHFQFSPMYFSFCAPYRHKFAYIKYFLYLCGQFYCAHICVAHTYVRKKSYTEDILLWKKADILFYYFMLLFFPMPPRAWYVANDLWCIPVGYYPTLGKTTSIPVGYYPTPGKTKIKIR